MGINDRLFALNGDKNPVFVNVKDSSQSIISEEKFYDLTYFNGNIYAINADQTELLYRSADSAGNSWSKVNVNIVGDNIQSLVGGLFDLYVISGTDEITRVNDVPTAQPIREYINYGRGISEGIMSPFKFIIFIYFNKHFS